MLEAIVSFAALGFLWDWANKPW